MRDEDDRRDGTAALLHKAAATAAAFRDGLAERHAGAEVGIDELRARFGVPLPRRTTPADDVLDELIAAADGGLTATAGPRFFGFVIGGALDVATAADMIATGWDQCAFNGALSPAAMAAEEAAGAWLKQLLGLPSTASVGFVSGGQEGNTVGLAAARHHVLSEAGWDVGRAGMAGAPPLRLVAGAERHATIDRAARLLGLGDDSIEPVGVDGNGAVRVDDLHRVLSAGAESPTIVCLQAGNVNTGAVDDLRAACEIAHSRGAWVHVDGAFGLWAAASPGHRHLVAGIEEADSWSCDGHKWLNLPYDVGFVFCSRPQAHAAAVSYTAAYLTGSGTGEFAGADFTLSSSRRARGFATWAALRHLGIEGVSQLVERCCSSAEAFARQLAAHGLEVVNDVVLNQVLVALPDGVDTDAVIMRIQQEGTCWLGGTTWRGRRLLRISVSSWSTTPADVERSVAAIVRAVA